MVYKLYLGMVILVSLTYPASGQSIERVIQVPVTHCKEKSDIVGVSLLHKILPPVATVHM